MILVGVTGTRRRSEACRNAVQEKLSRIPGNDVYLVHGGATGADEYADEYARSRGWQIQAIGFIRCLENRGGPVRNCGLAAFCAAVAEAVREDDTVCETRMFALQACSGAERIRCDIGEAAMTRLAELAEVA